MSLILIAVVMLVGAQMLRRRGAEPSEPGGFGRLLKSILGFRLRVIEDGKEPAPKVPKTPKPGKDAPAVPASSSMDKIYDPPLALLEGQEGYGIELNSNLTETERVDEIMGLQELWDKSEHDTEKEEKGS